MLYTFAPFSGPHGSSSGANLYYLPPAKIYKPQLLTEEDGDKHRLVGATGSFLGAGTGPAYPSGGVITTQFFISNAFLLHNGNTTYATGFPGIYAATSDFAQWVKQGGLGILLDRWWTGTAWDYHTCTCRIEGKPQWDYAVSGAMATLDCTFFCPTGQWTASDGTTLTYFH